MHKKFLAELIGTFGLGLAVNLGVWVGMPIGVPVLAGLVVGIFVYTIGSISGAHLNPAVTIGAWSIQKISTRDALGYIVAQVIGAGLALAVGSQVAGLPMMIEFGPFSSMLFLAEVLGTAILAFGIASVILGRTPSSASGLVIGGSLLVGATMAGMIALGAGFLNPAVAFALRSLDLTTILGPIAGSLIGFWTYRLLV